MLQEKYRPETLHDMKRVPAAQILHSLPFSSISNIIFVGPEGAGKRTLFSAFLKHTFKNTPSFFSYTSTYEVSPSKTIEVEVLESKEVLEIKLEGMGMYDKKILQKIATDISATKSIKNLMKSYEHAQNQNEDGNAHSTTKVSHPKILFIPDGHLLSTGAQMALRRILEKGACNFQLVLLTNTLSHLIPAFKSRFLICRVPAPSDQDISSVISHISKKENISIPENTKQEIINMSNRNMRKAFSLLELAVHKEPLAVAPWDVIIIEIIISIQNTPSVKALVETREKIYKLLNNQVPSTYIFETILQGLLKEEKRVKVAKSITEIASKYTARLCAGTKDMFHIEAFIANVMSLYADLE
ncbi:replication factor C subunit 3/5 [Nematocida sp. ERTm5]|nr:replication factor C subunit 3/5 [Nematocida sp. ERTm5]